MARAGSQSRARSVYADALDSLIDAGARTVVLDVGLQGALDYFDDNALVGAMTRAAGRVRTVATEVRSSNASRVLNMLWTGLQPLRRQSMWMRSAAASDQGYSRPDRQ